MRRKLHLGLRCRLEGLSCSHELDQIVVGDRLQYRELGEHVDLLLYTHARVLDLHRHLLTADTTRTITRC